MKHTLMMLGILGAFFCNAMTHNLAWPWSDGMSPPQTPYLVFSSPQSETLMFDGDDELLFNCQAGLRAVELTWSLHANGVNKAYRTGVAEGGLANRFSIRIPTKSLPPGFYDLKVELDTGTTNVVSKNRLDVRPVKGVCTFGWKVAAMTIPESRPADFKAFWETARRKLDAIAPDAKLGETTVFDAAAIERYNVESACLPPSYDPQGIVFAAVESCKINLAGPDGGRVYGWLAKPPSAPGRKYPAVLVLPGAGNAKRSRPLEHARHGFIALDIQVHGFDVDLDVYPPLKHEQPKTPEEYSYYNIHLRCLQALNYLCSRPDVDTSRIIVCGGSQGGRLSTVMAGWDPRIAAAVPSIAHFANQPHLNWTKLCNGKKVDGIWENPPYELGEQDKVIAYYDAMNFARDIKCPVFYNMGLVDFVSPPFGIWAIFKNIPATTDKTLIVLPGSAHDWCAEFDRQAWRWLEKHGICPRADGAAREKQ